jgi:hypothetical protein
VRRGAPDVAGKTPRGDEGVEDVRTSLEIHRFMVFCV